MKITAMYMNMEMHFCHKAQKDGFKNPVPWPRSRIRGKNL